ncbi:hypothetical protein GGR56DRAFT_578510 [Xylariaceae sp. FL0804]|nr:hypothetical protein GGR56DRAFT_578510 [Xylariaceae sp. FL0804]
MLLPRTDAAMQAACQSLPASPAGRRIIRASDLFASSACPRDVNSRLLCYIPAYLWLCTWLKVNTWARGKWDVCTDSYCKHVHSSNQQCRWPSEPGAFALLHKSTSCPAGLGAKETRCRRLQINKSYSKWGILIGLCNQLDSQHAHMSRLSVHPAIDNTSRLRHCNPCSS